MYGCRIPAIKSRCQLVAQAGLGATLVALGWGAAPEDVLVDLVCFEAALCQRGGVLGVLYQSLLGPTSQGNKQEG